MNRGLVLVPVLVLGVFGLPPHLCAAQEVGLPLGSVVTPVQIEDLEGNAVDLGQYIGKKPVLLEFWATWCPLCEALQPRIEAAAKKHGDAVEFVLVAVAVNQTKNSINRHMQRHPLPGRVLWDTQGRATRALQAPTTSYIVVLDRAGRVVYTGVGDDQDIEGAVVKALR